jgi:hypothetical protein
MSDSRNKLTCEIEYRGRNTRCVADQLILRLKPLYSNDAEAQKRVLSALPENSTVQSGFDELGIAVVNLPPSSDLGKVATELEACEEIAYAEPNFIESA